MILAQTILTLSFASVVDVSDASSLYPQAAFSQYHSTRRLCHASPKVLGLNGLLSRHPSQQQQLYSANPLFTAESLSAAAAIAGPTLAGMKADRLRSGIGPLITIVSASYLSSRGFSPSAHHLYEMCWTRFLPASLSLLLLAPTDDDQDQAAEAHQEVLGVNDVVEDNATSKKRKRVRDRTREEILAMSIPFLLGCLGSIVGCLLSYFFCWLGKDNAHRPHKYVLTGRRHYFFRPGRMLLEPNEAAVAAGCLLSSYIGGSTNYFATARIIAGDQDLSADANVGAQGVIE